MNVQLATADITAEDIAGVVEVLESGRLAMGPRLDAFEHAIAERVGVTHAIAVSSGTAGLHVILASLGIGPGQEVIVPSFTFAASVNAILLVGATPVFCDIDPTTYCLDPADVEQRITSRTRAVMVVDVFGHPADWLALESLAQRHALLLIDDCCEALGSEIDGRPIGSFGNAACFAFYPNKQITTGEGGMIVTNDDAIAESARSIRNQGRGVMGAWLQHERLGFNYRMDEMSASLGLTQLARLDKFIDRRSAIASEYGRLLADVRGVTAARTVGNVLVSWFVYVILLDDYVNRDAVMTWLEGQGVPTRAYFSALHWQPYLLPYGTHNANLPVTESIANRTMAIPFHTALTSAEIRYVVDKVSEAVLIQTHGTLTT